MTGERRRIEELVRTARKVRSAGLVVSSSGNVSVRLGEGRFAISASGSCLGELDADRVSVCSVDETDGFEGPEPSLETPMHRSVYRVREDVGAVLHFQSPYATVLACAKKAEIDIDVIPEIPAYIRKTARVPFRGPGTPELARAVADRARDPECDMLVLANHGQIAVGKDLATVLRNAEFFEFACRLACQGVELERYDRETVELLRKYGNR